MRRQAVTASALGLGEKLVELVLRNGSHVPIPFGLFRHHCNRFPVMGY